jgi:hypothetical protein
MKFLADPLRFERVFTHIERLEHSERSLDQLVIREYRPPSGDALIRKNSNQGMNAVVGSDLI